MRRIYLIFFLMSFFFPLRNVWAAAEEDGLRAVYATACEPLRGDEAKSSARTRATDKASFKALENLSDLSDYRSQYDAHDYNVLVYTLVDNYLEDLAARTIEQTDDKICVEVTGYLQQDNIAKAVQELAARQEAQYPDKLSVEEEALTEPSPTALPPKPEPKISKDIAVETLLQEDAPAETPTTIATNDGRVKVFIERTKFHNGTTTNAFATDLTTGLSENTQLAITNSLSEADYIVRTKVLRAKVDPINKQTSRLQMVVALELINTADSSVLTEHQNRFILFEGTENEQSVAASLLKKLLRKAAQQIAPKIKTQSGAVAGSIITPPKN